MYVRRRCSVQQVCSEHLWLSVESSLLTTHGDGSLPLMTLAVDGLPPSMGATIAIIAHSVHYGSYRRSLEYRLDRKRVE